MHGGCFDLDRRKEKTSELKVEMSKPNFWNDRERAVEISRNAENEEKEISQWENLKKEITDLEQFVAEASSEKDLSIADEADEKYRELKRQYEEFEFFVLFSGKYDKNNAIISIHAGTGGVDAQDWAQILERMFLRFAEKKKWKAELIDRTIGNEAGIKSASLRIMGNWAYGYLKSESGVHRLVRISPFDAEKMRHTSFALAEVIPELPEAENMDLKDGDLRIDSFRSSGPGGQSVNKTDSAIRVTHIPTGITVACQTQRSQHQNKETALKILKSKLFKLEQEKKETQELELRGEAQRAEWGKQIRSYVMQPYQMVKDHRTEYETADIQKVLDGGLEEFMEAYLRKQV
ncbi:MAG: peptide chain release factor 2 [bacterium]